MDCYDLNTWPVWAVIAMAILSHTHGTVLFFREALSVVVSLLHLLKK